MCSGCVILRRKKHGLEDRLSQHRVKQRDYDREMDYLCGQFNSLKACRAKDAEKWISPLDQLISGSIGTIKGFDIYGKSPIQNILDDFDAPPHGLLPKSSTFSTPQKNVNPAQQQFTSVRLGAYKVDYADFLDMANTKQLDVYAAFAASYQRQLQAAMLRSMYGDLEEPYEPEKLPAENKFGEIEAHRIWNVEIGVTGTDPILCGAHKSDRRWLPGRAFEGKPLKHVNGGAHAWKERGPLFWDYLQDYALAPALIAFGRVKLWGDVVEHEGGYRAQYAKVIAIDGLSSMKSQEHWDTLERLRALYVGDGK